ncbi:MAG: DUF2490 domain-containing protein [Bacteroidota bacterium]
MMPSLFTSFRSLCCLLLLSLSANVMAQENNGTDSERLLWTGVEFNYKLNKKWKLGVEQQFRFEDSFANYEKSVSEISVRRKLKKWWNLKLTYRFNGVPEGRNSGRIALDSKFEWDPKNNPVDFKYRLRIQDETVYYTGQKITFLRQEIELDANLSKRVDPQLSYEHFYRFNGKNETRVHRFHLGLTWKLNKDAELKTFYRIDQEVNTRKLKTQHIFGASLAYDLN